uniref:Uncharacterized protein n=1 Tax=Cannabis sativa TaxID=3483 RepID=A0A803QAW5_CANSA
MPISISDHAPIILDTHLFASRGFIPFRFFEAWTWEESCKQEVASAWSISNGNNTASFIKNIHKARKALQAWKKKYKTMSEGDIKDLENRLQWLQNQPISELFKEEEARIQSQIRISWSKLEREEEIVFGPSRIKKVEFGRIRNTLRKSLTITSKSCILR